jgi:hypothetical protein
MAVTSYREYALDLYSRIRQLRTAKDAVARVEITITRNSYCYKSSEEIGGSHSARYYLGPLNSVDVLVPEDGSETSREIARFFDLPEIYAYSDLSLASDRSPLARSHWDGTVALVEVRYMATGTAWHQRMLFIGFDDRIHADFTAALDSDIFLKGSKKGDQLFEWRSSAGPGAPASDVRVPVSDGYANNTTTHLVAGRLVEARRWLQRVLRDREAGRDLPNA